MAATGYTPIQLYYSTTAAAVPTAGNLASGELAINITDGKLYYKSNAGVVTLLAGATAGPAGGSNTQVQFNSSGALAGSANMTFDGTTLTSTGFAGPLNGTVGATTANTGAFTTLSATGQITSTAGGTGIFLNNGTSNLILYTTAGLAAPTFTTRSAGTKLVLYPALSSSAGDFGFGTEANTLWSSVPTTSSLFRWYGGTTVAASLSGAGRLIVTEYIGANGATPTQALTVNGNALINDGAWYGWGDAEERIVGNNTGFMQYFVNGAEQMRLLTAGLVVGTTTLTAGTKFNVTGNNVTFTPNTAGKDTHTFSTGAADVGTYSIKNDTTVNVLLNAGGTSYFNGGNVAIGATSSSQRLLVSNSATNAEGFRVLQTTGGRTSGGALGLFYDDQAGTTQPTLQVIQNGTGDILQLFDAATQVVTVKDGGNVGIGNSSPSTKLHVSGSSPAVRIDGTAFGNSGAKLQLLGWASSESNWQIDTASISNGLEFVPSTAAGGSTFSTPAFSMLSSGIFTVSSGIQFPATQVASGGANVLDDYEEGTFTPTFSSAGATFTYGTNTGFYTKIGRLVYANIYIRCTGASGTTSNGLSVAGLPFTSGSASFQGGVLQIGYSQNWSGLSYALIESYVVTNATTAPLLNSNNASLANVLASNVSSNTYLVGTYIYESAT